MEESKRIEMIARCRRLARLAGVEIAEMLETLAREYEALGSAGYVPHHESQDAPGGHRGAEVPIMESQKE